MNESERNEQREREEERERSVGRGYRDAQRDHDLTVLDEREARDRMREAQERYVRLGFSGHLIAVQRRRGVEYSLELHSDGAEGVSFRDLQEIADELALDLSYSGTVVVADPRPRPNWSPE